MGETGEDQPEKLPVPLDKARDFVESSQKGISMQTSKGVAVDIHGILEIIDKSPGISLLRAEKGDVVWWKTKSGSTGYFYITAPYESTEQKPFGYGRGDMLISRPSHHPLGDQHGEGRVRGATLGATLKFATIIKGQPIEFDLREPNQPANYFKVYATTPVTDMGIIKAGALS